MVSLTLNIDGDKVGANLLGLRFVQVVLDVFHKMRIHQHRSIGDQTSNDGIHLKKKIRLDNGNRYQKEIH